MRTTERLRGLKAWTIENLCKGRELKAPADNMDLTKIVRREPGCYIGWAPSRSNDKGLFLTGENIVCPAITIMPRSAYAKYTEGKRFDYANGVVRPMDMAQHLAVDMLFSVYEPGTRQPGFVQSGKDTGEGLDATLLADGTEQGLFTLTNWMDDAMEKLLERKMIPGTDLYMEEETMTYSLYYDQSYIVDKRPIYYGFVSLSFMCYVEEGQNPEVEKYLN